MDKIRKFVDKKNENGHKSQLLKTAEDLSKVAGGVGIITLAAVGIIHAFKDLKKI